VTLARRFGKGVASGRLKAMAGANGGLAQCATNARLARVARGA
jgi:hypothetical protein